MPIWGFISVFWFEAKVPRIDNNWLRLMIKENDNIFYVT